MEEGGRRPGELLAPRTETIAFPNAGGADRGFRDPDPNANVPISAGNWQSGRGEGRNTCGVRCAGRVAGGFGQSR